MSLEVGADIEALCGRCGDVWHVVVAKFGDDRIAKVLCKQCGRQHRYRPPPGQGKPASGRSSRRSTRKGGKAPARSRSTPASSEPLVPAADRPVRAYRISETYAVGDRVEHSKFGRGVVEMLVGPGKIQVFFPGGRRVLAHERDTPAT